LTWHGVAPGFEVAALQAFVAGGEVDRVMLARIDPIRYRFAVYNDASGSRNLNRWMSKLGAALVVNGSYFSRYGTPDTPFISNSASYGPASYDARGGAFVASSTSTTIHDLSKEGWKSALQGAHDAMVSYPLLVKDGAPHVSQVSDWLANRSFVGEDADGRIIIGTTRDAYFSLDRLGHFLAEAPLRLIYALNLDGGPVACQGISLAGYKRKVTGQWEYQVEGEHGRLLRWPWAFGSVPMPIVLAVYPK
jgi:exopolysaccharide biosynthesis protein